MIENIVGIETRGINWSLRWTKDGREAATGVEGSQHTIYRVMAAPATPILYEALLSIGCGAATGWTEGDTEQDLVDAIWGEFADRDVRRTDGLRLGYWMTHTCASPSPENFTAAKLIESTNGRCGAWADLLIKTLAAQGVGSVRIRVEPKLSVLGSDCRAVPPIPGQGPLPSLYLLVHHYTFGASALSGCPNFPRRFDHPCVAGTQNAWPAVDASEANGAAAQGQNNTNPWSIFNDHALVKHGTEYYDPSYGTGPWDSILEFEQNSIDGYAGFATEQAVGVFKFGARVDDFAVEELEIAPPQP